MALRRMLAVSAPALNRCKWPTPVNCNVWHRFPVKNVRAVGVTWANRAAKESIGTISNIIGTKRHP